MPPKTETKTLPYLSVLITKEKGAQPVDSGSCSGVDDYRTNIEGKTAPAEAYECFVPDCRLRGCDIFHQYSLIENKTDGKRSLLVRGWPCCGLADHIKQIDQASKPPTPAPQCQKCHADLHDNANRCSSCKRVSYCNRECQKADWKDHKPQCA